MVGFVANCRPSVPLGFYALLAIEFFIYKNNFLDLIALKLSILKISVIYMTDILLRMRCLCTY